MSVALAALCGTTLLLITAWSLYQRKSIEPAQRAWQQYCRRLESYGITRAEWEGPIELAKRVAHEQPNLAALTKEAAKHYADLRYGQGKQKQLQQLRECVHRLPRQWRTKA